MKFVLTAAALAMATACTAGEAEAADFNVGGMTLIAGGEVDMNYTTGVEAWAMEFTPHLGTEYMGVGLSVETTVDLLDLDTDGSDVFTGLTFGASAIVTDGISAYGEVDTNKDLEFGDVKLGMLLNF